MLRAIGFDLWGTLVAGSPESDEARAADRVQQLDTALRAAGWAAPSVAITDAVQATVDSLVAIHTDNRDVDAEERVALFYRHLDPALRPDTDLSAPARQAISDALLGSAERAPPTLLPGVPALLAELRRRGLRLALVSNTGLTPGVTMRRVLDRYGIAHYFTAQVYSDEVGAWKPDARMFDAALFALGVSARRTAFVGDTPEVDIVGAQAFGMAATALVGDARVPGVRATLEIEGVAELIPALCDCGLLEPVA